MTIPKYDEIWLPALELLSDGIARQLKEFEEPLGKKFELSEEDLGRFYESGKGPIFFDRIAWALSYLSMAGLVDKPKRGVCPHRWPRFGPIHLRLWSRHALIEIIVVSLISTNVLACVLIWIRSQELAFWMQQTQSMNKDEALFAVFASGAVLLFLIDVFLLLTLYPLARAAGSNALD
jgi:hypothetical protein